MQAIRNRKRGFTLVEVIVVLGIIIGLSTVVYGYVQSSQQAAQTSRLLQDIDYVRAAVVNYAQTRGGNLTGISEAEVVGLGLLPGRFNCDSTAGECAANPFGASWGLAVVGTSQYKLTITSTGLGTDFFSGLAGRYGSITAQVGNVGDSNYMARSVDGKTADIVDIDSDADKLELTIQPI